MAVLAVVSVVAVLGSALALFALVQVRPNRLTMKATVWRLASFSVEMDGQGPRSGQEAGSQTVNEEPSRILTGHPGPDGVPRAM